MEKEKKKNDFFKSIGKAVTVTDQGATLEAKPAWIASLQWNNKKKKKSVYKVGSGSMILPGISIGPKSQLD